MKPIKVLYVHGYLGHGDGPASMRVRKALADRHISYTLDAPEFPITEPGKMREMLDSLLRDGGYDYVAASSMGAFFLLTGPSYGVPRILVNPAMPENLLKIREADPEGNAALTDAYLEEITKARDAFFEGAGAETEGTWFIFGTLDTIAGNEEMLGKYFDLKDNSFTIEMEHRMDDNGAAVIAEIIGKQEAEKA